MAEELKEENFHEEMFEDIEVESEANLTESESEQNLNTEENILETPTEPSTEELPEGDKPKFDDKHYQSIADKRLAELTREKLERERLQAELDALKNPKQPEPELVIPVEPVMPSDYDPAELFDQNSSSYKYQQDMFKYIKDVAKVNEVLAKQLNAEKTEVQKQRQLAQNKASALGEIMKEGKTAQEAQSIYDWSAQLLTNEGLTAKRLIAFYEYENNNKPNPKRDLKTEQYNQRKTKEGMKIPPGVIGAEAPAATTPDDAFNDQLTSGNKYRL